MKMPVQKQIQEMRHYVDSNLAMCCVEILSWSNSGILKDGCVRKAASFLTDEAFAYGSLTHVENYIKQCAMERVIAETKIV